MNDDNELRSAVIHAVCASLDADSPLGALADDILAAIREHHAIVRLPALDTTGPLTDGCIGVVDGGSELVAVWDHDPRVGITDGREMSPTEARALAAALLAAADAAEGGL